ncbi:MAG: CHAT domain-containing protein [Melioribacteraceae bacterium]|nr:CHAT domain-containing protein [Melioribacteraceae bacterium]MCF8355235.1 CHAT domain-containing protein [Melioribacteraceae bacterium]MCF8395222.1 CHAT domain-containing protein [Melioribacteraceae bacterium]MCF8420696.1 CHAT domain-containing protein [Melioribacteraceae bacterium]
MKTASLILLITIAYSIFQKGSKNQDAPLQPLLYSRTEVESIQDIIGGDIELDGKVEKNRLLENLSAYDIIHFATHTEIDNENPLLTRFYISNKFKTEEENSIYISEIYPMNLKAKMSVLSSCNTGTGALLKGEGIISMARAFRFAGCPSVVMSLWEIDDISTSRIMNSFYGNLKNGDRKDEALRNAKLQYLKKSNSKTAAPIFWAAAVPIGRLDKLSFQTGIRTIYYILPAVILLLGLLFYIYIKRKAAA